MDSQDKLELYLGSRPPRDVVEKMFFDSFLFGQAAVRVKPDGTAEHISTSPADKKIFINRQTETEKPQRKKMDSQSTEQTPEDKYRYFCEPDFPATIGGIKGYWIDDIQVWHPGKVRRLRRAIVILSALLALSIIIIAKLL